MSRSDPAALITEDRKMTESAMGINDKDPGLDSEQ